MSLAQTDSVVNMVMDHARGIAREYTHGQFSSSHLLKALLSKDAGLVPVIDNLGKDVYYMREWADVRIEAYPKSTGPVSQPDPDDAVESVLREADFVRLKLGKDSLDGLCVLIAVCTPGVGFSFEQLKSFPVSRDELMQGLDAPAKKGKSKSSGQSGTGNKEQQATGKALEKFCVDKTEMATQGKIDPIIGRDKETRMVAEILGRRSKPNVIVIGEPGVGKTALIDGFALNIAQGTVPSHLGESRLFELDLGSLIAGASYKGEVEDRIKNVLNDVKEYSKSILFIDEIHALLDPNRGLAGCANLLKPELARGEITLIGATTNDEYREFLEPEEAFMRRFEVVKVEEPGDEACIKMLDTVVPFYEEHHGVTTTSAGRKEAIRLSRRYLKERRLPDAAIDLVDRTMAAVRMMNDTSATELARIGEHIEKLQSQELDEVELLSELKWSFHELENRISPILIGKLDEEREAGDFDTVTELSQFINDILGRLKDLSDTPVEEIGKDDIAAVVAHRTGIPIGKVQSQERERLMSMEEILKERVIGQDHAITILAESILESRSGLTKAGQPIGSFFFLGPTGTGKTELAKTLAEFLFADEKSLIRFDMSEFKEEHSAALLYGAPPGYVGYKEGGLLVNKIRQQPYAVVLFDEIEKAHPSVFDLFLQILDEGKLHDRLGKVGDFSNAVILFTSNIGSAHIIKQFKEDIIPKSTELLEIMSGHFRPEFLARLTEILPFRPIQEQTVLHIFKIQVNQLRKALENQGIVLEIDEDAAKFLAMEGFTPEYGARPLRGVIRNRLRRPLSRKIISGELKKGAQVKVHLKDGDISLEIKHEAE